MTQAQELQATLVSLKDRKGADALRTLAAVAGIPYRRIVQLTDGEGAAPTVLEITTINMLK